MRLTFYINSNKLKYGEEPKILKKLRSLWCPTLGVSSPQLVSSESRPTLYHANSLSDFLYKYNKKIFGSYKK